MKFVFIPLLLLIFVQSYLAQIITVLDIETNEPLEFVTIVSSSPKKITTTNNYGQTNLSNFKGSEKITFQLLGYTSEVTSYSNVISLNKTLKYINRSNYCFCN